MSKDLLINATAHRQLKALPVGGKMDVLIHGGNRIPGSYYVSNGGQSRRIQCYVTEVPDAKNGRKHKKVRLEVTGQ